MPGPDVPVEGVEDSDPSGPEISSDASSGPAEPEGAFEMSSSTSGAASGATVVFTAFGRVAPEIGATFISQRSLPPAS